MLKKLSLALSAASALVALDGALASRRSTRGNPVSAREERLSRRSSRGAVVEEDASPAQKAPAKKQLPAKAKAGKKIGKAPAPQQPVQHLPKRGGCSWSNNKLARRRRLGALRTDPWGAYLTATSRRIADPFGAPIAPSAAADKWGRYLATGAGCNGWANYLAGGKPTASAAFSGRVTASPAQQALGAYLAASPPLVENSWATYLSGGRPWAGLPNSGSSDAARGSELAEWSAYLAKGV